MAKLFIGCNHIDFIYSNTPYKGVVSKIILQEKTVVRIDYTSQDTFETRRYEASYTIDPSGKATWISHSEIKDDLAGILQSEIERNSSILQLE